MPLPAAFDRVRRRLTVAVLPVIAIAFAAACEAGPAVTPAITPGTPADPRAVVIIAKDYSFIPPVVDFVPGETVVVQVVNGGLVVHEAVIGPMPVQDAWETAEAATADAPPGPTPQVSVDPGLAGLRIVVTSGGRRDVAWTVPASAPGDPGGWLVGCHIPGHWAKGMVVPVRFVGPDGVPLATPEASTGGTLRSPVRAG
jgi:uncharacterized cupredoxin-like copper-binding protein